VEPAEAGAMTLVGEPYQPRVPLDAQRRGVVHVPADRLGEGGFPTLDSATNYTLHDRTTTAVASARRERAAARVVFDGWGVVPRSPEATFSSLSGGNQQKVILAKWMTRRPAVLVAEEPTAGIDVGTRAAIYERLAQAAATGASVLLMSSDADEVAAIADRAIVFAHGAPKTELRRSELSPSRIAQECFSA
jgi:ribose transport system ATP-binding protein